MYVSRPGLLYPISPCFIPTSVNALTSQQLVIWQPLSLQIAKFLDTF